jgi:SAM-dependent methyltransferase
MNAKKIIKKFLPPILFDLAQFPFSKNKGDEDGISQYLEGGRVPFTPGYVAFKLNFIAQTLLDEELMDCFRYGKSLPPGYGIGIDERCVEYPWVVAHLTEGKERLLDAGSAFNYSFILNQPLFGEKKIHIITLAPENNCLWKSGISYIYEDLRKLPIQDEFYDTITCLSTLEHIGFDNTMYTRSTKYTEQDVNSYLIALRELWRVLKPGGTLYVTVPFGKYKNFGTFQQFDVKLVAQVILACNADEVTQIYFRYSLNGWNFSTRDDCLGAEYVDSAVIKQPLKFKDNIDQAVAARAVACLSLKKPY